MPNPPHAFCDCLVLAPTPMEEQLLEKMLPSNPANPIARCGFGPIVSAARTAYLIKEHRPNRIVLAGIAGTYENRLPIGEAFRFSHVACYGVGVGSGPQFKTAEAMGWKQWEAADPTHQIEDQIELSRPNSPAPDRNEAARLLLTAPSASGNPDDAHHRLQVFPEAVAEDMEGFGVAAACQLADVRLDIVRGISNLVGDRNRSQWQIGFAMIAVAKLVGSIIQDER